jgi:hypothetical protein
MRGHGEAYRGHTTKSSQRARVSLSQGVTRGTARGDARPCKASHSDDTSMMTRGRTGWPLQAIDYSRDDGRDAWPVTTTQGERMARLSHRRGGVRCRGRRSTSRWRRRRQVCGGDSERTGDVHQLITLSDGHCTKPLVGSATAERPHRAPF